MRKARTRTRNTLREISIPVVEDEQSIRAPNVHHLFSKSVIRYLGGILNADVTMSVLAGIRRRDSFQFKVQRLFCSRNLTRSVLKARQHRHRKHLMGIVRSLIRFRSSQKLQLIPVAHASALTCVTADAIRRRWLLLTKR